MHDRPLRVLWFTNTVPAPWRNGDASSGGWIDQLREVLSQRSDIELGVAGFCGAKRERVREGRVEYFTVASEDASNRFSRTLHRWIGPQDPAKALATCHEVIAKFRPDLIHIHGTERYYGLLMSQVEVPCVVSIQGMLTGIESSYLAGVRSHPLDWFSLRRVLLASSIWHGARDVRRRAERERAFLSDASLILGRTDWDRRLTSLIAPASPYVHVDEPLRAEFYRTLWHGGQLQSQRVVYTTMGSAPYKGLEVLIEAVARLRRSDVVLRVGGDLDSSELGQASRRIARRHGLADKIVELGPIGAQSIAEEIARCDVYVSPSHADNSPNSLCEAQLVGAPCIAAAVGGVPSIIEDGVTGLLYRDHDCSRLAELLGRVLDDRESTATIARQGREVALRRHERDLIANDTIGAYLLAVNRARLTGGTSYAV